MPHVLIVDDNAMNVELAAHLLADAGFDVASAGDAEQGLRDVAAHPPDLVMIDIQLPGMDGLAFTRRVKADPALAHIAVMAFTAYAMKGDEARARDAGCDGYIAKPIDVATFVDRVRRCLADAQARTRREPRG